MDYFPNMPTRDRNERMKDELRLIFNRETGVMRKTLNDVMRQFIEEGIISEDTTNAEVMAVRRVLSWAVERGQLEVSLGKGGLKFYQLPSDPDPENDDTDAVIEHHFRTLIRAFIDNFNSGSVNSLRVQFTDRLTKGDPVLWRNLTSASFYDFTVAHLDILDKEDFDHLAQLFECHSLKHWTTIRFSDDLAHTVYPVIVRITSETVVIDGVRENGMAYRFPLREIRSVIDTSRTVSNTLEHTIDYIIRDESPRGTIRDEWDPLVSGEPFTLRFDEAAWLRCVNKDWPLIDRMDAHRREVRFFENPLDASLVNWILSLGAGVTVVEPESLRAKVIDEVKRMALFHQNPI